MVKIKFLGACREVGRSGVLIESEETDDKVLCDYGTMMDKDHHFPINVSGKDLSAVVLTHSHIDHCGALPTFYISGSVPLYTTDLTFQISEILLKDMLHLSGRSNKSYLPFDRQELYTMRRYAHFLKYGQKKKVGKNTWITLFNAGHIPGSAIVLVEMDGKNLVYTGDFNTVSTRLLDGADPKVLPAIDAIITETTYGKTEHSPRKEIEDVLIQNIYNTLNIKGTALIPAFGVARSHELMLILNRDGDTFFPITVDGMARKVSFIYHKYRHYFRDPDAYDYAMKKSKFIDQRNRTKERLHAAKSLGVIIAPSGMLKGGTARFYFESLMNDPNNSVNLVSYQVEGTPGRILIDEGTYLKNEDDLPTKVQAKVNHFDFSSHVGKNGLINYLNALTFKKEKTVFCVHGDEDTMESFTTEIIKLGFHATMPLAGEVYEI
jgi:putative mRNA 3-end processing factor